MRASLAVENKCRCWGHKTWPSAPRKRSWPLYSVPNHQAKLTWPLRAFANLMNSADLVFYIKIKLSKAQTQSRSQHWKRSLDYHQQSDGKDGWGSYHLLNLHGWGSDFNFDFHICVPHDQPSGLAIRIPIFAFRTGKFASHPHSDSCTYTPSGFICGGGSSIL